MKIETTFIASFVRESNGEAYAGKITAHIKLDNDMLVIEQGEHSIWVPLGDAYQFLNALNDWFQRPEPGEEEL